MKGENYSRKGFVFHISHDNQVMILSIPTVKTVLEGIAVIEVTAKKKGWSDYSILKVDRVW